MLIQDLRHGIRLLLRSPGFTAVAVAALAIGIGANTAIFSVVNTLILQPLPYGDADRLAVVWEHNVPRDRRNNVASPGNFLHWRDLNQTFEDMATAGLTFNVTLTGAGEPEEVPFQYVTGNFFDVLRVPPQLGRGFLPSEDVPRSRAVVITDRLWSRRFNRDPAILERTITLAGEPHTVVGVMPAGFSFLDKTVELWLPVGFTAESRTPRGRWLIPVGRLRHGVTFERAQEDMTRVAAEMTRLFPDFNTGWTARVVPMREQLTGEVRPALFVLLGAVAFVLLIACANVANLLLARATVRRRELAVRAALGAGRGRLVRQLLTEGAVLAMLGAAAGLLLAWWALHLLRSVVAARLPIPRLEEVAMDGWVLAFTAGATVLSGLVFGLIPALSASGISLTDGLKEGGRSGAGGSTRARAAFVVVEVALALVLLVGAGLLVRSFMRVLDVDPGFDTERTVTMRVTLSGPRYTEETARRSFLDRTFAALDQLPGVEASGGISFLPMTGPGAATRFDVVGRPAPPRGEEPVCDVRVITHDYFRALGIPLLKGRLLDERNPSDLRNRIVINETMARRHWPNEDPIGKRVKVSWGDNVEDEVVGVVGDVRHADLETEPRATIYWPYARVPYGTMTLAVRTRGVTASTANAAARVIRDQDPSLAVADVKTMEDVLERAVAERRLTMLLLAVFAGAALLLAAVGIYGVIAYGVTERTREIGIRMALGAAKGAVLRMIVRQAIALTAAGIAIGALGAFLLTRLMAGLLFRVTPWDPVTFVAVSAVLTGVAALAGYVPARRATRVDPVVALRAE